MNTTEEIIISILYSCVVLVLCISTYRLYVLQTTLHNEISVI